jgi:Pectate lyase superfamily protein
MKMPIPKSVLDYHQLRLLDPMLLAPSDYIFVAGYPDPPHGGIRGFFEWRPNSVEAENFGTVIRPNLLQAPNKGRWHRVFEGAISVKWFGAVGDGTGNDADAINAAILALPVNLSSGIPTGQVYFPTGTYRVTETITIHRDRTHLTGDGLYATQILFDPIGHAALFEFAKPGQILFQCSLREMSFIGSGSAQKVAIRAVDTSGLLVERVAAFSWFGNGSIALQLRGRELTTVRKVDFQADLPISIEGNPNSSIDADHYHFEDLVLAIPDQGSAEACVHIQGANAANPTGVNATNMTFAGTNAFAGGKYGIFWKDAVPPAPQNISLHIHIQNIRHEQAHGGASGWTVYIDHPVTDFLIDGVAAAIEVNGFYFRQVMNLTMLNCFYGNNQPNSKALDIDASCYNIALMNVFFQFGSTVDINTPPGSSTGLEEVLSFFQSPNSQPPSFAFYQNMKLGATPLNRRIKLMGQGHSNTSDGSPPSNPNGWNQGDIAWNRHAALGQPVGWVHTGGAWHPFGTIL